jgi:hypothetical protein
MSFLTIVDLSSSGEIIRLEDSSPEDLSKLIGLTSKIVLLGLLVLDLVL